MKLTLTKEKTDSGEDWYIIRKDRMHVSMYREEQEAVEAFAKCVAANSPENKPILLREVEI